MENYIISILAVIASLLIILTVMKFLKFLWNKVIHKVIIFFKPELKNIYDLTKWIFKKLPLKAQKKIKSL